MNAASNAAKRAASPSKNAASANPDYVIKDIGLAEGETFNELNAHHIDASRRRRLAA